MMMLYGNLAQNYLFLDELSVWEIAFVDTLSTNSKVEDVKKGLVMPWTSTRSR